jgi:RNase P/RNase MRP subunit p29
MLIDGATGDQIGTTISGDYENDKIGSTGITVLNNGNFVIGSEYDTNPTTGIPKTGSVMLINGTTGDQIGTTIYGNDAYDNISGGGGQGGVTALTNGNFVVVSPQDDVGAVSAAGSVFLVNGATGALIGTPINGATVLDFLGVKKVSPLENGNYIIAAPYYDVSGRVDAGLVMLMGGTTGVEIDSFSGFQAGDKISGGGVLGLSNNEFMVSSPDDEVGGVLAAGSIMFYDATGVQIGTTLSGSHTNDYFGIGSKVQLANGNIVIASPRKSSVDGIRPEVGMITLVDGSNKSVVSTFSIDTATSAQIGSGGVKDLGNGNYLAVSPLQANPSAGLGNVGTAMIFNGTTGAQIGSTIFGDNSNDELGSSGVAVLENGNFILASAKDDVNGITDSGAVMLFNGATGAQIGSAIAGDDANDQLGLDGVVTLTDSNNYVIKSSKDDVDSLADAGSIILVNGTTGAQIAATSGDDAGDRLGFKGNSSKAGVIALNNGDYLISSETNIENGELNAGAVYYRAGK